MGRSGPLDAALPSAAAYCSLRRSEMSSRLSDQWHRSSARLRLTSLTGAAHLLSPLHTFPGNGLVHIHGKRRGEVVCYTLFAITLRLTTVGWIIYIIPTC
jgi:hypothetical protein